MTHTLQCFESAFVKLRYLSLSLLFTFCSFGFLQLLLLYTTVNSMVLTSMTSISPFHSGIHRTRMANRCWLAEITATCGSWSRVQFAAWVFFDRQTGAGHPAEQCDPLHLYRISMSNFNIWMLQYFGVVNKIRIPFIEPSQQYPVAIAKMWKNCLWPSLFLQFFGGRIMINYEIEGTLFLRKPSMAQWFLCRFSPVGPEVVSLTSGVVLGAFPGRTGERGWDGTPTASPRGSRGPRTGPRKGSKSSSSTSDYSTASIGSSWLDFQRWILPSHVTTRKTQEIRGKWQFQKTGAYRFGPAVRSGGLVGSRVKLCFSLDHRMQWILYDIILSLSDFCVKYRLCLQKRS